MAKACPINVCVAKDNISYQTLLESLQNLHIEAVKEILRSMDLTSNQLYNLSMSVHKRRKSEP